MKIYDCFTFWNESELLDMRLKHLWHHVDYFVISEANLTYRGKEKSWNLEKLLAESLGWAKEKIIYIKREIDISSLEIARCRYVGDDYNQKSLFWLIEYLQRDSLLEGLSFAESNDVILVGDLDEFPCSHLFGSYLEYVSSNFSLFSLGMRSFGYYMNVEVSHYPDTLWLGTVMGKMENMTTPQDWRNKRCLNPWEGNLGYHFTWIGKEAAKEKIKNTAHDEISDIDIERFFEPDENGIFSHFLSQDSLYYQKVDVDRDEFYPSAVISSRSIYPHLFI